MFCLKTAILNIRRHIRKSILVLLTCMLTVVFAFIFMNSIETNQNELMNLPQALPVDAQIENLNGSQMVGLEIPENIGNQLAGSKYVKNLLYTAQLAANFTNTPDEANRYKPIKIIGANDVQAVPDLQDKQIKLTNNVADTNFLHGSDALCLADDLFMQRNNLSPGDTVNLALYMLKAKDNGQTFSFVSLGNCSLRIVGTMVSTGASFVQTDLVCPVNWAKEKCAAAGVEFKLDSASFTVADPLDLNTFKAAMKGMYLIPVNPEAQTSVYGDSLVVKDETFIETASRLKNSLAVLYAFEPVIFIVIALVGYALAYLLMQSRRPDIVIMRSLGNSRMGCVGIMLIEYAVVGLAGCLIGAACALIWAGFNVNTLLIALLFFASLMLGVLAAAFQISGGNTMTGLKKTEA